MQLWLPCLVLAACDFSAATLTFTDSGDSGVTAEADADTDADSDADSDSDADTDADADADTDTRDGDGDGHGWDAGDCDDDDPGVYPGALDACDGQDSDCDGTIDEAAGDADPYEPNDAVGWSLGALEDGDRSASGLLHNDQDVDRYTFDVTDSWTDFFTVVVTLSNIPSDATYRLTLNRLSSAGGLDTGQLDEAFSTGGSVSLSLADEFGPDEGGTYEAVVEAIANADCDSTYLLTAQKK